MASNIRAATRGVDDDAIEDLGFDRARLQRVRAAVVSDIEGHRCHGVAMMVARHGKVVLEHY